MYTTTFILLACLLVCMGRRIRKQAPAEKSDSHPTAQGLRALKPMSDAPHHGDDVLSFLRALPLLLLNFNTARFTAGALSHSGSGRKVRVAIPVFSYNEVSNELQRAPTVGIVVPDIDRAMRPEIDPSVLKQLMAMYCGHAAQGESPMVTSNGTASRRPILTEREIEEIARKACRLKGSLRKDPGFEEVEKTVDMCNGEEKGEEYYNQLHKLCQIRARNDKFYIEQAFPVQELRHKIEGLRTVDKLRHHNGKFNGEFRQRGLNGKSFVAPIAVPSRPWSLYLQQLNDVLEKVDAFRQIDLCIWASFLYLEPSSNPLGKEEELLRSLQTRFRVPDGASENVEGYDESFANVMVSLGMQLFKRRRLGDHFANAQSLWQQLVERTDELYQVAEELLEPYELAVHKLLEKVDIDVNCFRLCPLKDPVRICEKAMDDYSQGPRDLKDGVIPEAWVADVIRGSIVVEDPMKMIRLQELLLNEEELQEMFVHSGEETEGVKVQLLRLKNKFSDKIPTHFRFMLNNIQITKGSLSMICELQVHHRVILQEDSKLNSHSYYNYFRTLLQEKKTAEPEARYEQPDMMVAVSDNHDDWDVRLEARIAVHQTLLKKFYWDTKFLYRCFYHRCD